MREATFPMLNLGRRLLCNCKRGDGDVATYQAAVILQPLGCLGSGLPPNPVLGLIWAILGPATSWSRWLLNFPFAPPSSGSDLAVTTARQGKVPEFCSFYLPHIHFSHVLSAKPVCHYKRVSLRAFASEFEHRFSAGAPLSIGT